jgi:uncharacterized protein (TIGR03435 family)
MRTLRHTNVEIEDEQLREMLQSLLIDRFQLRFHRETQTGDVIFLERTDKPLALRQTEVPLAGAEATPDEHTFGSIGYAGALAHFREFDAATGKICMELRAASLCSTTQVSPVFTITANGNRTSTRSTAATSPTLSATFGSKRV